MEKPWYPQRNKIDGIVSVLKTFILHLNLKISQETIEKAVKGHPEFPSLQFGSIVEILSIWGLQSITGRVESDKLKDLGGLCISLIQDEREGVKMGIPILIYSVTGETIEYLHPGRGWVVESLDHFITNWENGVIAVTGCTAPDGEPDFDEKEKRYYDAKMANPELKILQVRENFLSDQECEYIVNLSENRFKRSKVMSSEEKDLASRTSYSAELVLPNDEVLNIIKQRAADLIKMPASHFEFFQCVSYGPGQEFQAHYDTFDEKIPEGKRAIDDEGQRKYTMLAYLNDDFEGGHTYFPDLDIMLKPKKGRVIIFDNLDESGSVRKAAYHAGLPVSKGKKFAINMWVRTKQTIPSKYIHSA